MIENQSKNIIPLLQINPDFKALIPPLSEHELRGLEEDLKYHGGCYNPIFTWNGVIVDGHNRYEICQRLNLRIKHEEMSFEDDDTARLWIIDNQLGRRNISLYVRGQLILQKKEILSKGKGYRSDLEEQDSGEPDLNWGQVKENKDKMLGRTDRKLAAESGIGHNTLSRIAKIEKAATPEMKKALATGDISINDAFTKIRHEEKRKQNISSLEAIDIKETKALQGVYDVITIDPPWPIETTHSAKSTAGYLPLQYPTMSLDEIKALEIPCAEDCHVFLWTTQKFLFAAKDILDAWSLDYVCTFTWIKNGGPQVVGLPQYNTEFFLYGRKGIPKFVDTKGFFTALQAPKGKHSEKPQEFYDLIRRVTAGRRLDMFNRRSIEGFDGWGKEAAADAVEV